MADQTISTRLPASSRCQIMFPSLNETKNGGFSSPNDNVTCVENNISFSLNVHVPALFCSHPFPDWNDPSAFMRVHLAIGVKSSSPTHNSSTSHKPTTCALVLMVNKAKTARISFFIVKNNPRQEHLPGAY